jgi:vacuolar-type H+-ATPase subunit C/Vma6
MGDYDYLNARIRGMSTNLLSREFYEQVLSTEGPEVLADALLDTVYGPALQEALAVSEGHRAVESALRRNLYETFRTVRSLAPERPRQLLNVQFNQWDAANLLAVVRGKVNRVDRQYIMNGVLPAGEFSEAQLAELAGEPDVVSVANALTTWGYRFAFEVRRALLENLTEGDLVGMERAVNGVYFRWGLREVRQQDANSALARGMLQMQIDLANVRSALDHVRHRDKGEKMEEFQCIPGGKLSMSSLERIASEGGTLEAFETLAETYFARAIERGILTFGEARRLGVMERFLEQVVVEAGCALFRRDPLSLAVPLGFVWRKYNEFLNLRILLRGKVYRMPANAVRGELLYA